MLINSSLLDIEGTLDSGDEAIRQTIEKWIKDNFIVNDLKISEYPNINGKYEVSAEYVSTINRNIKYLTSLTNDLFVWEKVKECFDCSYCYNLKSLEGAPKEVDGNFACYACNFLTSLEGAPEKVGGFFDCSCCDNLTSLEGAPKYVVGIFNCSYCDSLISLEGAPEKVGYDFNCMNCDNLKSLEGAPKEIGGSFYCFGCNSLKTVDIPETTKVNGSIYK